MTAPWNDRVSPAGTGAPALSLRRQALAHPGWAAEGSSEGALPLSASQQAALPRRPLKPSLVPAKDVLTRSPFTPLGRATLLHAICYIEFNAKRLSLVSISSFHPVK